MNSPAAPRQPSTSRRTRLVGLLAFAATSTLPVSAEAQSVAQLAPWLNLPPGWSTHVENGVVVATPGDLGPGSALLVLIEPVKDLDGDLDSDYPQAVADLGGPWTPAADPETLEPGHGWSYRLGVGVTELQGQPYTALTAVARAGRQRARFWVLADNDDTYIRYQTAWANAITSVQRLTEQSTAAGEPATVQPYVTPPTGIPDGFGQGISGAYVGMDRGLVASAGTGGQAMTFDPRTGQLGSATSGSMTAPSSTIVDFEAIMLFLPDGTFRYGLPYRGMASDLPWDRNAIKPRWGTWRQENGRVYLARGGWKGEYVVENGVLFDNRGGPWVKLQLPGPQHVEGVFVREDFQDEGAPRLILHADGTYQDPGGYGNSFINMVASSMALVAPDGDSGTERWTQQEADYWLRRPSRGTYTLDRFTLQLTADDGRMWQVATYIPSNQPQDVPCRMAINTRQLVNLACR